MNLASMLRGGAKAEQLTTAMPGMQNANIYKPRTFREQITDQIAAKKDEIEKLQAVLDSMSPDVEKFVEALQKAQL